MSVQDHLSPANMKRHFISLNAICMVASLVLALPVLCRAQALNMNAFNASMSTSEASGETYRDCDVCPNKAGHAMMEDAKPLAKRCDTCSDTEVMGVETNSVEMSPDFTGYNDPTADSPASLKPF